MTLTSDRYCLPKFHAQLLELRHQQRCKSGRFFCVRLGLTKLWAAGNMPWVLSAR